MTRAVLCLAAVSCLALAGGHAHADQSVAQFMERYEAALDHADVEQIANLYELPNPQRDRKLRAYFADVVAEFNVEIENLQVLSRDAGTARIRFDRRDRFTDRQTGKRVEKRASHERLLRKRDGVWKFAPRR